MAVDTPVLERPTQEKLKEYSVPSRFDVVAEAEHNARIKDTYARLINPENKIEDILNRAKKTVVAQEETEKAVESSRPYLVENARADADIFRASSAINSRAKQAAAAEFAQPVQEMDMEDEDEELRPTPTTIQYQTIGKRAEDKQVEAVKSANAFTFGKKEKLIFAIVVAVVVALVALIIINSTVIRSLNADIAQVQDSITTVRGALAGVNSTVEEIINNAIGH